MQDHFDKIFDEMLIALSKDWTRTFTHYETKHFSNWYFRLSDSDKSKLFTILQEDRLEIVNGGWEMHEDACPNYADMLFNIYKGH